MTVRVSCVDDVVKLLFAQLVIVAFEQGDFQVVQGVLFESREIILAKTGVEKHLADDLIAVFALVGVLIFPPFSITGFADPPACPKLICPANVDVNIKRREINRRLPALPLRSLLVLEKYFVLIIPHLLWLLM